VSAETLAAPQGVPSTAQTGFVRSAHAQTPSAVDQVSASRPVSTPSNIVKTFAVSDTQMYVQAGAFSQFDNANRVKASLSSVGSVEISQVLVNGRDFYRVRLGPLQSVSEADQILNNVIQAGYPSAKIVVIKGNG